MASKKSKKILCMVNGDEIPITGQKGKYWICGETQFRKANPAIFGVKTVKEKEVDDNADC